MVKIFKKDIKAETRSEAIQKFKRQTQEKYIVVGVGRVKIGRDRSKTYPVKYRQRT